jgi:hypothetical protein
MHVQFVHGGTPQGGLRGRDYTGGRVSCAGWPEWAGLHGRAYTPWDTGGPTRARGRAGLRRRAGLSGREGELAS